jgi:hypothetical protein
MSNEYTEERINEIKILILKQILQFENTYRDEELRNIIETELKKPQRYFEIIKSRFFMEDLYPKNRQRFAIEFSDVCNQEEV